MSDDTTNNIHRLPTASIDDVLKEIEDWRVKKPNASTAIPDTLWQKIFALAKTHTASKIRSLLGISTKQYNTKYEQMFAHAKADKEQCSNQTPADLIDLCQVKTSPLPPPPRSATSPYKSLKIPASNTIVAEFYRSDGRIMKIHSTSESFSCLIQAFFQDLKNVADHVQT